MPSLIKKIVNALRKIQNTCVCLLPYMVIGGHFGSPGFSSVFESKFYTLGGVKY